MPDDVPRLSTPDAAETRLSDPGASSSQSSAKPISSSSGSLSPSGSIDHGPVPPGTLLGGRYRIIERLGRGGMEEIYRADDLRLAQPISLKCLPPMSTQIPDD